jgi:hypothetical protein
MSSLVAYHCIGGALSQLPPFLPAIPPAVPPHCEMVKKFWNSMISYQRINSSDNLKACHLIYNHHDIYTCRDGTYPGHLGS